MANTNGTVRNKKTCFVITPIGESQSSTRRHINSVIKNAIKPALIDKYEPIIPHELNESTTITKQIYRYLYESDLVIANLTELNPNVMYELAVRFCVGKPVIIIAHEGTKLPFDVKDHRTIFYINDYDGIVELRKNIAKALEKVVHSDKPSSPIHDALGEISLIQQLNNNSQETSSVSGEAIKLILDKLEFLTNITKSYSSFDDDIIIRTGLREIWDKLSYKRSLSIDERISLMTKIDAMRDLVAASNRIPISARNGYIEILNEYEERIRHITEVF